ncbi:MAG: amidohydrolase family protein [Sedimentisphaerales bacterium]|nr:amidohydrolase family protein [Sedimentisphaerales bacterium]
MLILHARALLTEGSRQPQDSAVAVQNGLIAAVGPCATLRRDHPDSEILDLTDCALLAGLVNAHTHLELSGLKGKVPYEGDFVDWLSRLGQARRQYAGDLGPAIAEACRQSAAAGVTCVGDICFRHRAWPFLAAQPIRKTCYAELFGMTGDLETPRRYLEHCIRQTETGELLRLGLSPHAPYSAGIEVYRLAADLAARYGLPLASHLAETAEEVEYLLTGGGPWPGYLARIHHEDGSFVCPRQRPVTYFLGMDLPAVPFCLAHVNYISDPELEALARTGHAVAFCPRSHAFFGHPEHPFARMLELGIPVSLGTDSLASNDSLSILDEMRFLRRRYPKLETQTILRMATINGARAVGWGDRTGAIRVGLEADLTAIPLQEMNRDPLADILSSDQQPKLTMVRGQIVHRRP